MWPNMAAGPARREGVGVCVRWLEKRRKEKEKEKKRQRRAPPKPSFGSMMKVTHVTLEAKVRTNLVLPPSLPKHAS
jgi:hypothetical protein